MPKVLADDALVVLFDGQCNLCSGTVQRLITLDPEAHLRFASLQSTAGQHLRRTFAVDESVDSIVVISDGRALVHSSALIAIGRALPQPWKVVAAGASLIPRPLRDAAYRFVAAHRYRWFGQPTQCWLPSPQLMQRFLPDGQA